MLKAQVRSLADALAEADARGSLPLALPSGPRSPLPGDRLAGLDGLSASGPVELRAWIVPTLALDPAAGAGLLLALGGGDLLTVYDEEGTERELPLAPSVAYAHAIAAFADALVSRGEIHPWLAYQPEESGYFASWVPAYALESAAHRRSLISAMPPSFRSQLLGEDLAGLPAEDVFDNALAALVDAYVLAAFAGPHGLHGEPLAPATRRRAGRAPRTAAQGPDDDEGQPARSRLLVPEEADELIDLLEAWTTAAVAEEGPVRTCFRLRDPGQQAHDVEDGRSSCCSSRLRTLRCSPPLPRCGSARAPRGCCGRRAWTRGRRCCRASAARRATSRSSARRCGSRARTSSAERRAGAALPAAHRARAARTRLRRPAAAVVGRKARAGSR